MSASKLNETASATTSDKALSDLSDVDVDESRVESTQQDLVVAKDENRWVWRMRFLVALVLMSATIAVCLIVYFDGRKDEYNDFERDFAGLADKLVISFESVVKQRFGAINMFFSDVTANANQTWPLVTPPDFTRRISELHSIAGLSFSLFLMRVEEDRRTEWEGYSVANQGWIQEGMAYEMGVNPEDVVAAPILPVIMDVHSGAPARDSGPGPYYPIWMMHPASFQSAVNVNLNRDPQNNDIMDYVAANKRPALGANTDYLDPTKPKDAQYRLMKETPNLNYQDDAFAIAQFPVFDKLGENSSVAAIFFTLIYWRDYFNGLLPKGSDGIHVILENTCGQQITYIVDGLEAKFAGYGDFHSPEYEYLQRDTSIDLIFDLDRSTGGDDPTCHYSIRVYPSDEFRDRYETNEPWQFAMILALVFVSTAAVFILYDCMVERRQKAVMKSAQQSGKIVHSLFPEAVRDRLYEEQEEENKSATWETKANQIDKKQANAAEYPETTIFFADLVGFTKWSATRTPVEVFQLLEALYGEFDTIANRRTVFKVETIGDCYVAVAGLPNPQESMLLAVYFFEHAEIMIRFSVECLEKMRNVVSGMVDSLGEDTANLAMRVGLHSGPVTGGVLRGAKSRFQLFGDTVNTASRMESNGMSGKIHVSQSTADELVKLGRSSWLVACGKKLPVKGKGDMQTYFVQPSSLAMTASVMSRPSLE
ncbi:MAG: hypothetical protein SGBAC_010784 [Bacillariaceae sp.]